MVNIVALLSTVGVCNAFAPRVGLQMSTAPLRSIALPWLERPADLGPVGVYAGDCGFDPLNLASPENLASYRDAEIKHARLAMLAAAGWPISELFDVEIAKDVGLPADVVSPDAAGIGLAPSLLNGGLSAVPLGYWLIVLSLTGFLEIQLEGLKRDGRVSDPGDFGFDPLGLYPKDPAEQMIMKEKEEASSRIPVVEEAPAFFGLTPGERVAEAEVAEVAKESEDVIYNVLHNILHLI